MGQPINWKKRRDTPSSTEVGQLLAQRSMGGEMAEGEGMAHEQAESPMVEGQEDGATGMADPDQMTSGSDWPTSDAEALRAAIIRGPGKPPQNQRPAGYMSRMQLEKLGLSSSQIDVLNATGGSNA